VFAVPVLTGEDVTAVQPVTEVIALLGVWTTNSIKSPAATPEGSAGVIDVVPAAHVPAARKAIGIGYSSI
jgi:hypothetical protein